jgi:hypothetical protein
MVTPMGDASAVSYRFNVMSSASSSSSIVLKQSFEYTDHSLYLLFGSLSASAFFLFFATLRVYYFLYKASRNESLLVVLPIVRTHHESDQLFSPSINGADNHHDRPVLCELLMDRNHPINLFCPNAVENEEKTTEQFNDVANQAALSKIKSLTRAKTEGI